MRSQQQKDRLRAGDEVVLEGTAEDFSTGDMGVFQDTVIIDDPQAAAELQSAAAAKIASDQRSVWHYANAPLIFPNQNVTEGTFRKQGEMWMEERVGGDPQDWKEVVRTPEYVELGRPLGDFFVRLFDDHSQYRRHNETNWSEMFPGGWKK